MKRIYLLLVLITGLSIQGNSQQIFTAINEAPEGEWEDVWTKKIFSDPLSTSTLIWIRSGSEIKLHKHEEHTEHVYVLEGSGDMHLGNETMSIVAGDVLIIPKNTPHSLKVTSQGPIKVISIQSPEFLGKDRIYLE